MYRTHADTCANVLLHMTTHMTQAVCVITLLRLNMLCCDRPSELLASKQGKRSSTTIWQNSDPKAGSSHKAVVVKTPLTPLSVQLAKSRHYQNSPLATKSGNSKKLRY